MARGPVTAGGSPFALELEILEPASKDEGPRVHALVKNVAKTGKRILVDHQIQPVTMTLVGPDGKAITPFDERSRKKLDTTRHKYLFRVLGPSSEYAAREDEFRKENGAWSLRFGSFTYSDLAPGSYRAKIAFTSAGREWFENGVNGEYEDLWEGTVESPEIELTLPK